MGNKELKNSITKTLQLASTLLICAVVSVMITGCLGPQVLKQRAEHFPAPDPKIELRLKSREPADVLVLYDERALQNGKVRRRAFYLFANEDRITEGKRPFFVNTRDPEVNAIIPILKELPVDAKATTNEMYAVSSEPGIYRLESHGHIVAEFGLPEYGDWLTAKKLFLFPLAVGADAAAVGVVASAAVAEGMVQSGTVPKFR